MANMSIYDSEPFKKLFDMEFSGFAEDALNEAAIVLEQSMKTAARYCIKHDGESEMVNSIKASKAKKSRNGAYIVNVGPRGYSSYKTISHTNKTKGTVVNRKIPNALKAIWKEYGIPGRQSKQPFIQKATNDAEASVLDILEKYFDREID